MAEIEDKMLKKVEKLYIEVLMLQRKVGRLQDKLRQQQFAEAVENLKD